MIISASRRTDIPAFYAPWFMNRVREGYCTVPNAFNSKQVSSISLQPEEVDVFVFWTRNPGPLMPYLDELDEKGYLYYFQYTVLGYPRALETKTPPLATAVKTFKTLAERIGPEKLIWRYDPIVFSSITDLQFHAQTYAEIAGALQGYTRRSVVSIMDYYGKLKKRFKRIEEEQGIQFLDHDQDGAAKFEELMVTLSKVATEKGMEIVSCAETIDLTPYGIRPGKCVDDTYIEEVFGIDVTHKKDRSQRKACGCVQSRDIGMYNSCLFGCQYCYATTSFEKARTNIQRHDPQSPSLLGWFTAG